MFGWRSARGRAILTGVAFMLLLAAMAAVAVFRVRDIQEQHRALEHASAAIASLEHSQTQFAEGQAALAALVLLQEPALADTFRDYAAEVDQSLGLAQAEALAGGDPERAGDLDRLTRRIARFNGQMELGIPAVLEADRIQALRMVTAVRSEAAPETDLIRADLAHLIREGENELAAERAAADRDLGTTVALLVAFAAAAFVGGTALVIFVVLSVVRSLGSLRTSTKAIASGDLKARAEVSGPTEVAQLARDFNVMVTERQRAEEALRRAHDELETRVKTRTADLTSANERLEREVADRKRAEEALRESEAKYRSIFENVQDIFYRTDARGIITEISPSVERWGYTREGLIGTQVLDVYENPEERSALLEAVLEQGEVVDYEIRLKTGDGRVIDTSVNTHVLPGPDGSFAGVEGALRDITERKRTEEALRESEAKYRRVVQDSLDGIAIAQGLEVKFVNTATVRMLGYDSDAEMLGRPFTDFVSPEFREVLAERAFARDRRERVPDRYEHVALRKDGTELPIEVSVGPISYQGAPAQQVVIRDIAERKRTEEALRESEAKYRGIFENVQDIYYRTDAGGIITEISPSVERYGYTREGLLGTQVLDVYENPEERSALLKEVLERGEVVDYEIRLKTGDGRVIDTSVSTHVFRGPDGSFAGVEGALRDISERKRMEEALREQTRRDPLTGALNHIAIVDELRGLISSCGDHAPCGVAMIDVDGLKATNDTCGHQVGDAVLVTVAGALSRDDAIVGRYGGDEFVALLPKADRDAAERYRQEVLASLADAGLRDPETGGLVPVAVSVGLAIYPAEARRLAELIKLADSAMYAAKRQRPVGQAGEVLRRPLGSERAATMVGELVPLLTSPGDLNEKLRLVAHRLSVGAGYDAVNVDIYPREGGLATARNVFAEVANEVVETWRDERRSTEDDPFVQLLLQTRRPLIVDDPQNDGRLTDAQRGVMRVAELKSAIVVPLFWQDEIVGSLSAASKRQAAFTSRDAEFLMAVATQVSAMIRTATLVDELQSASDRLLQAQAETVMLLAAAAEARDHATGLHLQNVRAITEALAHELGYGEEGAVELGLAAVLHDIGKIRVPDLVVSTASELTDEEWELMRQHTIWGGEFLAGRPGFELAASIARSHHERWDGTGYPDGLSGDDIPVAATIVAVADAFDAMTTDRPYKAARSVAAAAREIVACSGRQFSPKVAHALARLHKRRVLSRVHRHRPDEKAAA